MSTSPFLKQNKKPQKPIKIYVSDNFVDSDGNQVPFILKIISTKEVDALSDKCMEPVIDPRTHRKTGQEINQKRLQEEILAKSIISPDLADEELQKSWGVNNEVELLNEMLDFKERSVLVTEFDKYFQTNEQKAEEAEEETKNE